MTLPEARLAGALAAVPVASPRMPWASSPWVGLSVDGVTPSAGQQPLVAWQVPIPPIPSQAPDAGLDAARSRGDGPRVAGDSLAEAVAVRKCKGSPEATWREVDDRRRARALEAWLPLALEAPDASTLG